MKITVCDRCGSRNNVNYTLVINGEATVDFPTRFSLNKQYDLCKNCAIEIAEKFVEE